jgi:glycosyltransferase involved in cell wall biosynthesis
LKLRRHGKEVVYDSHEDLPRQILDKPYLQKFVRKALSTFMEWYENRAASKLSGIVTATPHIKERFNKLNRNVVNINNYPVFATTSEVSKYSERKNEVCYIGGIFETRGIKELVDAIELTDVRLNLAGNYSPESLRSELEKKSGWKKVNEYGFVDREQINRILSTSKIGIVTLYPTMAYLDSLPIKMFEYMAAGIPVIASDFPLWKSIIDKYGCGLCVNPQKPAEIANAINYLMHNEKLAEEMGRRGMIAVKEECNWKKEGAKLVEFYNFILNNKGGYS